MHNGDDTALASEHPNVVFTEQTQTQPQPHTHTHTHTSEGATVIPIPGVSSERETEEEGEERTPPSHGLAAAAGGDNPPLSDGTSASAGVPDVVVVGLEPSGSTSTSKANSVRQQPSPIILPSSSPTPNHPLHPDSNSNPYNPEPNERLPITSMTLDPDSLHQHEHEHQNDATVFGTAQVGIIGKHRPREILRIDRDYSGGETAQFSSIWPVELQGRIDPTSYANTLNDLNSILLSAHDPYKSIWDNTLAVLSLYIVWAFGVSSHYEREMRKFDKVIEEANKLVYNPNGLNILDPRKTGYLYLEIEYY